jgi:hypothetical protein
VPPNRAAAGYAGGMAKRVGIVSGNNVDAVGIPGVTAAQTDDGLSRGVMANQPNVNRPTAGADTSGGTTLVTATADYPAGANKSGRPGQANPATSAAAAGQSPKLKA